MAIIWARNDSPIKNGLEKTNIPKVDKLSITIEYVMNL